MQQIKLLDNFLMLVYILLGLNTLVIWSWLILRFTIHILLYVNIAFPMLKLQVLSSNDSKPFAVRSELGLIVVVNAPAPKTSSAIDMNMFQLVTFI